MKIRELRTGSDSKLGNLNESFNESFLIFSTIKGYVVSEEFKIFFFLTKKHYVGGYSLKREMLTFSWWKWRNTPTPAARLFSTNPDSIHQQRMLSILPGILHLKRILVASHWTTNCFIYLSSPMFYVLKNRHIDQKDENEASVVHTDPRVPFTVMVLPNFHEHTFMHKYIYSVYIIDYTN